MPLFRNPCIRPPVLISCPVPGKIELSIDQGSMRSFRIAKENSYLAVLHLSETPTILPFNSYRMLPMFWKSGFVDVN
jgi:hypothetical protein